MNDKYKLKNETADFLASIPGKTVIGGPIETADVIDKKFRKEMYRVNKPIAKKVLNSKDNAEFRHEKRKDAKEHPKKFAYAHQLVEKETDKKIGAGMKKMFGEKK